jgi:hypothetical protein
MKSGFLKKAVLFRKWRSTGLKSTVTCFFVKGLNDHCGCRAGGKAAGA